MSASRSPSALMGLAVAVLAVVVATPALAATLTLSFTAPGDDGTSGRAAQYDVRYSTSLITAANFALATRVTGLAPPQPPGTRENIRITTLLPSTIYWFAIKTADEAGNWSSMSNVVMSPRTTTSFGDSISIVSFSAPQPNPARTNVRLSFELPRAGNVRMEVFDLTGRHVRTLFDGRHEAGSGDVVWDLGDAGGASVNAGVYMVRATMGGRALVQRLAVVR